ncbi:MAG: hypothetical protein RR313_00020 [Anaerovoracaceae bacterium]
MKNMNVESAYMVYLNSTKKTMGIMDVVSVVVTAFTIVFAGWMILQLLMLVPALVCNAYVFRGVVVITGILMVTFISSVYGCYVSYKKSDYTKLGGF